MIRWFRKWPKCHQCLFETMCDKECPNARLCNPAVWFIASTQIGSMSSAVIALSALLGRFSENERLYRWVDNMNDPGMSIVTAVAILILSVAVFLGTIVYEIKKGDPQSG